MWQRALILAALLSTAPCTARAQWQVGAGIAIQSFGEWVVASPDRPGDGPDGRPTTTWPVVVEVHHGGAGGRFGLAASRSRPGLEFYDADLRVALRPGFQVLSLVPTLSMPLVGLASGGAVRVGVGAPIERWTTVGSAEPPRWRIGVEGTLSMELPITARLAARVSTTVGTLLSHPLRATDSLEDYLPTNTWRRSLSLGVMVRM